MDGGEAICGYGSVALVGGSLDSYQFCRVGSKGSVSNEGDDTCLLVGGWVVYASPSLDGGPLLMLDGCEPGISVGGVWDLVLAMGCPWGVGSVMLWEGEGPDGWVGWHP